MAYNDLKTEFSIKISRANYILLMRKRHELFKQLEEKGVVRNVSFDNVITDLLIKDKGGSE